MVCQEGYLLTGAIQIYFMLKKSIIILSLFLFITGINPVVSQTGSKTKSIGKIQKDRSTVDLMNLISNKFIGENPLREGQYNHGNWDVIKNSREPKMMWWGYPTGVTLLALQQVYEITHDKKLFEYVNNYVNIAADQYDYQRWQAYKFGKAFKITDLNRLFRLDMLDDYGAIGAAILETELRHNVAFSDNVNDLVDILANQIKNIQYRLDDGTLWRPNSPDGPTIWADDLYMGLPFLIRLAEHKKDPNLLNDAILQVINYASYLQDTDGVWYHAYFVDKKSRSCCKWGRANGWVAVAIAQVLTATPSTHPKYEQLLNIYRKHINGLIKLQSKDGLWNQVLDHPELSWGTETTCSAQFIYSIARGINKGWLDSSYTPAAIKALNALSDYSRISERGDLLKVCSSTSIGNDLEYYNTRKPEVIGRTDRHGDGLILLALSEMSFLLQNK